VVLLGALTPALAAAQANIVGHWRGSLDVQGTSLPLIFHITGSGPQNRDEAIMGHRSFLVLADHLTRYNVLEAIRVALSEGGNDDA